MSKILKFAFVAMLMTFAAPAYASKAVHIFACEVQDEVTEEKMEAATSAWLKAAKTMKGGENLQAYLHHPVVAKMDNGDVLIVIVAPSLAEWGVFWDGYKGSAADQLDKTDNGIACPNSALWEAVEIK
jgi:hypothetical protein